MPLATHKARESFVAELVRRCPNADVWYATRLMRYGSTYSLIQQWKREGQVFSEHTLRKEVRIKTHIEMIARDLKCCVIFDERSNPTVKLLPKKGSAICVPTS